MNRESLQLRLLGLSVGLFGSTVLLLHKSSMDAPFIIVCLVASAWTVAIALQARRKIVRNAALVCSSVLFSLVVIETFIYWVMRSEVVVTRTIPDVWRQKSMSLGSLPLPNTTTQFDEFLNGQRIAHVTYRIDANGLREIPATAQGRFHKVAFFGCSFMFGHGVENDQTLPYYFVENARGTFEGFNFAGEGWGPHQMLREIETGFVRRVAGAPELAIYEAIPDHLRRVAGRAPWEDGPKYELCRGNDACYSGPFHSAAYEICRRWLNQSWAVRFAENHLASLSRPSDIPLFLAVLEKTRTLLNKSGTRLVIVLWDQNELAKTMMKTLRANRFDVVGISSIVAESDLRNHPLTQLDAHPSPETNKAIAAYLLEYIGERLAPVHSLEKQRLVLPRSFVRVSK